MDRQPRRGCRGGMRAGIRAQPAAFNQRCEGFTGLNEKSMVFSQSLTPEFSPSKQLIPDLTPSVLNMIKHRVTPSAPPAPRPAWHPLSPLLPLTGHPFPANPDTFGAGGSSNNWRPHIWQSGLKAFLAGEQPLVPAGSPIPVPRESEGCRAGGV